MASGKKTWKYTGDHLYYETPDDLPWCGIYEKVDLTTGLIGVMLYINECAGKERLYTHLPCIYSTWDRARAVADTIAQSYFREVKFPEESNGRTMKDDRDRRNTLV